jgi:hypothetical protein
MKKLKELKELHNIFVDTINELDNDIQEQIKKIKAEYQKNMIDEKMKLLLSICNGEGLNFEAMKTKYFRSKELSKVCQQDNSVVNQAINEEVMDCVEINNIKYYCEVKEDGIVYNSELHKVGSFKNGQVILD